MGMGLRFFFCSMFFLTRMKGIKPTKQLNSWLYMKATPRLSEDKVRQCVDPRLGDEYPPKAVAKVNISYYQVKELDLFPCKPESRVSQHNT
jgi:hypothetical protein